MVPDWDGIDNDATLTFKLYKNGLLLPPSQIWIGSSAYHPSVSDVDGSFALSRFSSPTPVGVPATITLNEGIFIYYNNIGKTWTLITKDHPVDGYEYSGTITSSGEVYNVRPISGKLEANDILRTTSGKITFKFNIDGYDGYDGYDAYYGYYDGMTFMADEEHYFIDYGKNTNENRFSIYKDGRGYLNFRVCSSRDRLGRAHQAQISKDISSWKNGDKHFIAASWRLASKDGRDEMHLFVDGQEVPNIVRYGGRPAASSSYRFRNVIPEIVSAPVPANTLAGNDLIITSGSDIVTSGGSDFPIAGITVGSRMYIEDPEILHPVNGYFTITQIVSGNSVRLDNTFTYTMHDVVFSVNRWKTPVSTQMMYETNIAVSLISGGVETEIPGLRAEVPSYAIEVDEYGQPNLIIRNTAQAGDLVAIRTLGLSHRRARDRKYVWGTRSNVIHTMLAPPINLDHVEIYSVIKTKYVLSPAVSAIIPYGGGNGFHAAGIMPDTQPSNESAGRLLSVSINGNNVNFDTPVLIDIHGTTYSGAFNEVVQLNAAGSADTVERFLSVSSIDATAKVFSTAIPSISFEIKETSPITFCDGYDGYDGYGYDGYDGYCPVIRYSQKEHVVINWTGSGNTLYSASSTFFDTSAGKAVQMTSPASAAGMYTITSVLDEHTLQVQPAFPVPFANGHGSIYNISISRSGFANGMFTFEAAGYAGVPYYLKEGYYDFDYAAYLEMPFELDSKYMYIGSNFSGAKQADAIIDELRCLSADSSDTRVGEVLAAGSRNVTTDYNTVNPFTPDTITTLLMHFDEKTADRFINPLYMQFKQLHAG